jgi:hypothetical protein
MATVLAAKFACVNTAPDPFGPHRHFNGSMPKVYGRYLVPLVLQRYAVDLGRRLATLRPARVLETASGMNVIIRAMTQGLPDAE